MKKVKKIIVFILWTGPSWTLGQYRDCICGMVLSIPSFYMKELNQTKE